MSFCDWRESVARAVGKPTTIGKQAGSASWSNAAAASSPNFLYWQPLKGLISKVLTSGRTASANRRLAYRTIMMPNYIRAIHQGTTSSRFIVFDRSGRIVSTAQREHEQIYPKPGWVEHD